MAAILRKLDLRDRTQAAVAAYELGLVRRTAMVTPARTGVQSSPLALRITSTMPPMIWVSPKSLGV